MVTQIRLTLGDRLEISPETGQPVATIVIRDRRLRYLISCSTQRRSGLRRPTATGVLSFGRRPPCPPLGTVYRSEAEMGSGNWFARVVSRCMAFAQRNSLHGARQNIHRHYDLSNEFFHLWLDDQMVYSCAYFAAPSMNLDAAQRLQNGLHLPAKLNLKNGGTCSGYRLRMGRTCPAHGEIIERQRYRGSASPVEPGPVGAEAVYCYFGS